MNNTNVPDQSKTGQAESGRFTLYELLQKEFEDKLPAARLPNLALIGASRTIERVVRENHLPTLLFSNYQDTAYWQEELNRHRRIIGIPHTLYAFADFAASFSSPPDPTTLDAYWQETIGPGLNEVLIPLDTDDPLRQEWFMLVLTPEFSLLVAGRELNGSDRPVLARSFETLISFEPAVITRTLDRLAEVIAYYRPDQVAAFEADRRRFPPLVPRPGYLSLLATQFVERVSIYRQKARQLDQEEAMRATIARLLHDASQPVTILLTLLDYAQREEEVNLSEIDLLVESANQLQAILDRLREVNRYRTQRVQGQDYLDTGRGFFESEANSDKPKPA